MFALTSLFVLVVLASPDYGKMVLDVMQQNFTGKAFNESRWNLIVKCMESASSVDLPLHKVSSNAWNGFLTYARSNGSKGDPWGMHGSWLEWNPQPMCKNNCTIANATNIYIVEPCDYVSNVAYYTSMLSVCSYENWTLPRNVSQRLIAAFNTLAVGSSFLHGSATQLGGIMDVTPIGHIALASYQAAVHSLPLNKLIVDIRNDTQFKLTKNATDIIWDFSQVLLNEDVYKWRSMINNTLPLYQSNYYITFGCTVVLILRLTLPSAFVTYLIPVLCKILGLEAADIAFISQVYDPAIIEALHKADVNLSFSEKMEVLKRSIGVLLKMFYAFFWQEQIFKGPWLYSAEANDVGGWLLPVVNKIGDLLTGYPHPDYVKESMHVYPGDSVCRHKVAHAKWHEQSANALVDLIFLTDDVHKTILEGNLTAEKDFLIPAEAGCFNNLLDISLLSSSFFCEEGKKPWQCLFTHSFGSPLSSMDSCLLQNDCVSRSPNRLYTCTQQTCVNHVRAPAVLDECLRECSDMGCSLLCLRQNTNFSPLGEALVDCAPLGFSSIRLAYGFLNCVATRAAVNSSFWKAVQESTQCALSI